MKAYQMIYTACGKNDSGAYSVWSKSNEISEKECTEIYKLMSYKKPNDTPYEPTPEEINTLFPKKFSYFELSSGRKCIAKSTYVGPVYSTNSDYRSGNFLIHAFVFEEFSENPFGIFDLNIFKEYLEESEWKAPAPEFLDTVELDLKYLVPENRVRTIVSKYKNEFFQFLQAVIKASKTNEEIFVSIDDKDIAGLFETISVLLPKEIWKKMTFCTQYTNDIDYQMEVIGGKSVQIKNLTHKTYVKFNYQDELQQNHLVFLFDKNIYSPIELGDYIKEMQKTIDNLTYFEILNKVDSVNSLMQKLQIEIDEVSALNDIVSCNFNLNLEFRTFKYLLLKALDHNLISKEKIYLQIYKHLIKTNRFTYNLELLEFIKVMYSYLDNENKLDIIHSFLLQMNQFVDSSLDVSKYQEQFLKIIPFPIMDFMNTIDEHNLLKIKTTNEKLWQMVLHYIVNNLIFEEQFQNLFLEEIEKLVNNNDFNFVKLLMVDCQKNGFNLEEHLYSQIFLPKFKVKTNKEFELLKLFDSLELFTNKEYLKESLYELVLNNMESNYFMNVYEKFENEHKEIIKNFEKSIINNDLFQDFLEQKELLKYRNNSSLSIYDLSAYVEKFYIKGKDKGLLYDLVNEQLRKISNFSQIDIAFDLYKIFENMNVEFQDVIKIIDKINQKIFSFDIKTLCGLTEFQFKKLDSLNETISFYNNTSHHYSIKEYPEYDVLKTIYYLKNKNYAVIEEQINNDQLFKNFSKEEKQIIYDTFHHDLFLLYLNKANDSFVKIEKDKLINTLIITFYNLDNFKKSFFQDMIKLKKDDRLLLISDFLNYALKNEQHEFINIIEEFLKKIGKKEQKNLLEFVKEKNNPEDEKLINYLEKTEDKNVGFFAKLFGKKNKGGK